MSDHPAFDEQWAAFIDEMPAMAETQSGRWAAYRDGQWRLHDTERAAYRDACQTWGLLPFVVSEVEWPRRVYRLHDYP